MRSPDEPIRCLLLHTQFSEHSYWNYKKPVEAMGAKTPSAPLGLITVAALLPQNWEFRLLDLNARAFCQEDWDWAELLVVGGMLPQQEGMLNYIDKALAEDKFVAVGGADPSMQPDLYAHADTLVIGEGELTIPMWLDSWRKGEPRGRFSCEEKPDITTVPIPRFDLLRFKDYFHVGVQYSRGCPFNCEFCDIIELFGRKPRTKTPEQILAELEALYDLGYRGSIELVDDNFIGNKRMVKRQLLPALIEWQRKKGYPYYFNTEASMNMADDKQLLRQMRAAEFRYIFMGIESPDPDILMQTQKSQNTMGDIVDRVHTLYEYGMVVLAGFIMGFDGEKSGVDKPMIDLIERANICMAMVGLLVALPQTQLTRRLRAEGRLLDFSGKRVGKNDDSAMATMRGARVEVVDHTSAGLNFETKRDKAEILREYANVVAAIYEPKTYADRVIRLAKMVKVQPRYLPSLPALLVNLRALARGAWWFSKNKRLRFQYWRTFFRALPLGPFAFEVAMRNMGMFMHFDQQTQWSLRNLEEQIQEVKEKQRQEKLLAISDQMKQAAALAKPQFIPAAVDRLTTHLSA